MKRPIIGSILVEAVVVISLFLVVRLAATRMEAEGFSFYILGRRVFGMLSLPLMLGLGLSLPRTIPGLLVGDDGSSRTATDLFAAFLLSVLAHFLFFCAVAMAPGKFTQVFFGGEGGPGLLPSTYWALIGLWSHGLGFATLRGMLRFDLANSLKLLNLALIPVVVTMSMWADPWSLFPAIGMLQFAVTVVFVGMGIRGRISFPGGRHAFGSRLKFHLGFGLPRVPGEIAVTGVFAVPVVVTASQSGPLAAAQFSVAVTLVGVVVGVGAAVDLVMLPSLARLRDLSAWRQINRTWWRLTVLSGVAGCGAAVGVVIFAPQVVDVLLGEQGDGAASVFRLVSLAMPGAALFTVLRGFNDALDARPHNSYLSIAALGLIGGLLAGGGSGREWLALVVGVNFLGLAVAALAYLKVSRLGGVDH